MNPCRKDFKTGKPYALFRQYAPKKGDIGILKNLVGVLHYRETVMAHKDVQAINKGVRWNVAWVDLEKKQEFLQAAEKKKLVMTEIPE